MKKYVFVNGDIETENLDAKEIKKYEKTLGELTGVITEKGFVPVFNEVQKVAYNGEYLTIMEWSEKLGISESTLRTRYRKGDRGEKLFREVEK